MTSPSPTLLIPIDFSEPSEVALTRGIELAERLGATVELIYVAPKMTPLFPRYAPNRQAVERLEKEETDQARAALEKLRERSELIVKTSVLRGTPHEVITSYAEKTRAELIVIGTTGHSLAGTVVIGSTTERVLRHTSVPVVVVPAVVKPPPRRRKRAARKA